MLPLSVLLLLASAPALGYPDGAPRSKCSSMEPRHDDAEGQDSEPPYTVAASVTKIRPGGEINVTISGIKFKGYILEARNAKTGKVVGSFTNVPSGAKTLNCKSGLKGSAVTQSDDFKRTSELLVWKAPKKLPAGTKIYFIATVVKDYDTYWLDVMSSNVTAVSGKKTKAKSKAKATN